MKTLAHVYTRMSRDREDQLRRTPRARDSLINELLAALEAERQEMARRLDIAAKLVETKTPDETLTMVGAEIRDLIGDEDAEPGHEAPADEKARRDEALCDAADARAER